MNQNIFLLLGSNLGDPLINLAEARENINKKAGTIVRQSSVYRSAAWGMEQQPDFRNQVLQITSTYSPEELLSAILEIELEMGRVRKEKWGPRLIDIDLLLYASRVIDTPSLKVPHPGIPLRRFTLVPLAEIASDLVHPALRKTIAMLLSECTDPLKITKDDDAMNS